MEEDGSSSVFFTSNLHHLQQQSVVFQHQQLFQQNLGPFHQLQSLHQPQCEPRHPHPHPHHNSGKNYATLLYGNEPQKHSLLAPHYCHPQEDSPMKHPFLKPLNRSYGELEAIYGLAKGVQATKAGSGSALTGEDSPANVPFQGHNVNVGSETSIGQQASLRKIQKKKRKKRRKEQLSSMLVFFETLVKQVTDHQEGLHKKLIQVIEKIDKERSAKEESWRQQEAEKHAREAIDRANEHALASSREALIVSCMEKITGQSINLSPNDNNSITSRWPSAEVEALIQGRCNLEPKFHGHGLKGSLWEEVSSFMASLGYQRNAKKCKEKWENINKYFRQSKGNGKKRSQNSKTCTYFDQLDQIYSRIPITCPTSPRSFD